MKKNLQNLLCIVISFLAFSSAFGQSGLRLQRDIMSRDGQALTDTVKDKGTLDLAGLFLGNLVDGGQVKPNIIASGNYTNKKGTGHIKIDLMGFQNPGDTVKSFNALNLINPEVSQGNLRINYTYNIKNTVFVYGEANVFTKRLSGNPTNSSTNSSINQSITGTYLSAGVEFPLVPGKVSIYGRYNHFAVASQVENYEKYFSTSAPKSINLFEFGGTFLLRYLDNDFYIKPTVIINSQGLKDLSNIKDPVTIQFRFSFDSSVLGVK